MIRIIDGVAYELKSSERFKLKAYDLGNGQFEATAVRQRTAVELEWTRDQIADHLEMLEQYHEEHAEEIALAKAERCARNAAQRAKKRVRQLCKAMGADTLLTLTYRANQADLDLCKRHLKEFNRRIERVMPGFRFVAAFEKQKRGAWHVHMACHRIPRDLSVKGAKVKSFNVIRAIWRAVAGELGGNIDVSARKRNSNRKAARIASYISKYIVKGFAEGEAFKNRWTKYGDFEVPPPIELGYVLGLREALESVLVVLSPGLEVDVLTLDRWHDWAVLHASPSGG